MNAATNTIAGILLAAVMLLGGFLAYQTNDALSGVPQGSEYNSTIINSSDVGTSTIKNFAGTLGSVVITATSATSVAGPYIAFYDNAPTTTATTSLTAKIQFGTKGGTTPPAGTYEFDVAFGNGIYIWVDPAFTGNYTVTYR